MRRAWVPVFYTLAVIWIYRGLFHQHGVATGLGWDTIDTHGPDLDFLSRELAHGRFSLWNPYDKGGYPLFCDPVFDRYYPLNWPFAAWGAIGGTSWWLVQVKVLAHHVIAGTLMHGFLRTRGLSVRASMIGGLGLVAAAPLLTHKASNVLWPIVWVPLVWMAIDFALARPSWRRGVAVAAALVPCLTAGSPPGLFYALLLVVPYAGWRFADVMRVPAQRTRELAMCIGAAAVVVGLVLAATILPTSELVALGSRDRVGADSPDFALVGSLSFPAAVRGLFVRGAGPFEVYCGTGVVLLAALALVLRAKFDRGGAIVMIATAALGIVLAAGTTAVLLPFLVEHAPGFGLLRVPGRYKLLCAWSLAAAAGYGAAALEAQLHKRRALIAAATAVAIVAIAVAMRGLPATVKDHPAWWSVVATAIAAVCVVVIAMVPKRWASVALGGLAIFVLVDAPLFTFVEPGAPVAAEPRQMHDRDDEVVARLDGVHDRWRAYDEFVLGERAGARLGIRDFRGYPAVDPISLHRYVDVLEYAKQHPAIVASFNVRWALVKPHFRYGWATSFLHMPDPAFVDRGDYLWEAKHPTPLVAWYGAVSIVPTRDVLAAVLASDGRAIVERGDLPWWPPASGDAELREGTLDSFEPDVIRVAVDAPRAGLVVLNEIYFPGWHVDVDGEPAMPVRANYMLRGVWVPAGHHQIVWRFEPAHWRMLVGAYVLALALIAAAAAAAARRRRR